MTSPIEKQEINAQLRTPDEEAILPDEETVSLLEGLLARGIPGIIVSITQLEPVRWQMRDTAILAQTGSALMREATGTPERGGYRFLFSFTLCIIERQREIP